MRANIEDRERVIKHQKDHIQEILADKVELENTLSECQDVFEGQLRAVEQAAEEEAQVQEHKVKTLETELQELREFRDLKDYFDKRSKEIETERTHLLESHAAQVGELQEELRKETERLQNDKHAELEQVQAAMQSVMAEQLDATTKRTMKENREMSAELRYQSSRTVKLVTENDQLKSETKQVKLEMQLSDQMQVQMANRVRFYERLFKKMEQRDQAKLEGDTKTSLVQQSAPVRSLPANHHKKPACLSDDGGIVNTGPSSQLQQHLHYQVVPGAMGPPTNQGGPSPAGGDSVVLGSDANIQQSGWLQQPSVENGDTGGERWSQEDMLFALDKCAALIREHVDSNFALTDLLESVDKPDPATLQATIEELDTLLIEREQSRKNTESIVHYNAFLEAKLEKERNPATTPGVQFGRAPQPPGFKRGRSPRVSNAKRQQPPANRKDQFKDWITDSASKASPTSAAKSSKLPRLPGTNGSVSAR
jgi:hypothetical protein